jgi:prepilin-type processing-associated H-X9-DG protein
MNLSEFCKADSANYQCPAFTGTRGFTFVELVVVMATVAVLICALLPVLARERAEPQATQCFSNFRQLDSAWLMYAQDNNNGCAGNEWSGNGGEIGWWYYRGRFSPTAPLTEPTNWVSGWLDPTGSEGNSGSPIGQDSDNTNTDLLIDPHYASLGDYTKSPVLYQCPSSFTLVDSNPAGGPRVYPQIRTVSMNCWVGYISNPNDSSGTYKEFKKTTQITAGIEPSDLFVFIEERAESIDDGNFWTAMGHPILDNWPANYHDGAATVGFADGHVEFHTWAGERTSVSLSCTVPPLQYVSSKWGSAEIAVSQRADLQWLQTHASCLQ